MPFKPNPDNNTYNTQNQFQQSNTNNPYPPIQSNVEQH
jgi:hypothetical protein